MRRLFAAWLNRSVGVTLKRSMPGWRQKSVLLKQASIEQAAQRLKQRGDRTDFSDLMQALLEAWLQTPEAY